jgi:GDP-4-dehydro-6-deoxy-D-mannose reductase
LSDFVRRVVWLERHPEQATLRVGNLETSRTIVDVRDLVAGLALLLENGKSGDVYNLGGSTAYRMSDVLSRVLARSTRSDIRPAVDEALLRPTDEAVIWGDCRKLAEETGWAPKIPLEQTIEDMLTYWRRKEDASLVA